jgi:hypothetical protein
MSKIVELRDGAPFPVDVAAVEQTEPPLKPHATKISAYDFSRDYSPEIHFGTISVPEALRVLADRVEKKQILSQRVQVITEARNADYTRSALIFEYVETNREPRKPTEKPPCPECSIEFAEGQAA